MKFKDDEGNYYAIVNKSNNDQQALIFLREKGKVFEISSGEPKIIKIQTKRKSGIFLPIPLKPYSIKVLYIPKKGG